MLLAVTPNPTIDRSLWLDQLRPGDVHRAERVHVAAGGKGLNVARAARRLGCPVQVTGPLAGDTGSLLERLARQEGFDASWAWRGQGETRQCHLIHTRAGDSTVVNEEGDPIGEADWEGFSGHAADLARHASAVTISGSRPPGIPADSLLRLARRLASPGRPVYLDTSSEALRAVLAQPRGLCIKVNRSEFSLALGEAGTRETPRLLEHCRRLIGQDARLVAVTSGRTALAAAREGAWLATAPDVEVVSTVGSGDSFLAGLVAARLRGDPLPEALAAAAACGAANALSDLPARFDPEEARRLLSEVRLESL